MQQESPEANALVFKYLDAAKEVGKKHAGYAHAWLESGEGYPEGFYGDVYTSAAVEALIIGVHKFVGGYANPPDLDLYLKNRASKAAKSHRMQDSVIPIPPEAQWNHRKYLKKQKKEAGCSDTHTSLKEVRAALMQQNLYKWRGGMITKDQPEAEAPVQENPEALLNTILDLCETTQERVVIQMRADDIPDQKIANKLKIALSKVISIRKRIEAKYKELIEE